MAATFVASSLSATDTGTEPTGTQSGDVMYAEVYGYDNGTPVGPAGWTQVETTLTWNGINASHWTIVRGGSAPALQWSGQPTGYSITIVTVRGANTTTPYVAAGADATANASSTTSPSPSVTPTVAGLLICNLNSYSAGIAITIPSGMASRQNDTALGHATATLSVAAGATGAKDWTLGSADICAGFSIVIQEAATQVQAPRTMQQMRRRRAT